MNINKHIIVILDGLGIETFNSAKKHDLNNDLTLFDYLDYGNNNKNKKSNKNNISYYYNKYNILPIQKIPDSYLGHNEIICSQTAFHSIFIEDLEEYLFEIGCTKINGVYLYKESAVIGNNAETNPGLNINILSLNKDFSEELFRLTKDLSKRFGITRTIYMYGNDLTLYEVLHKGVIEEDGITFLSIPPIEIFNSSYRVIHCGKKIVNSILETSGKNITFIGKVAKLFNSDFPNSRKILCGDTQDEFNNLYNEIENGTNEYIIANIQKIDLCGHEQDSLKMYNEVVIINKLLQLLLDKYLDDNNIYLIADHGNDPCKGGRYHTYEQIPIIGFDSSFKMSAIDISKYGLGSLLKTIYEGGNI